MDTYENRRLNLLQLITREFGGNQTAFARQAGVSAPQVNRWVSETAADKRRISEESARQIEIKCGKPSGWLDGADLVEPWQPLPPSASPDIALLLSAWDIAGPHSRAEALAWARATLAAHKDREGKTT